MAFFLLQSTNCNLRSHLHKKQTKKRQWVKIMRIPGGTVLTPRTWYSHLRVSPQPGPHLCSSCVCCQDKFLLLNLEMNIGSEEPQSRHITLKGVSSDYAFYLHCSSLRGVLVLSPKSPKPCLLPTARMLGLE